MYDTFIIRIAFPCAKRQGRCLMDADHFRNLGRAAANIGRGFATLKTLDTLADSLHERIALVGGVVDGTLERGQWVDAVKMVFGCAGQLYDGNADTFGQAVVASAAKRRSVYGEDDAVNTLLERKRV